MSVQTDIFEYVTGLFGLSATPKLPTGNGFAVQIAPSYINKRFYDKAEDQTMGILLLGKNTDQLELSDSLFTVCNNIKNITEYEHGIYNIEVATPPTPVTQEGDYWIWSCIINVDFIL